MHTPVYGIIIHIGTSVTGWGYATPIAEATDPWKERYIQES